MSRQHRPRVTQEQDWHLFYGGPFSNFAYSPITAWSDVLGWEDYDTVEHFYQAAKSTSEAEAYAIARAESPAIAKALGQKAKLRPDWEAVKEDIMLRGLREKYKIPFYRIELLKTGTKTIVEDSPTDYYWGWGRDRSGQNRLGVLLMQVRDELRGT